MRKKKLSLAGNQGRAQNETGDIALSTHQYTPKNKTCQVLGLADSCLTTYNFHRAQYVATGSAEHFRLALAAWLDRQDLLGQLGEGA